MKRKNIVRRKSSKGSDDFDKRFKKFNEGADKIERKIDKEVNQAERWVIERRKFFIKLVLTIMLIVVLLIISNLFLTIKGVGW